MNIYKSMHAWSLLTLAFLLPCLVVPVAWIPQPFAKTMLIVVALSVGFAGLIAESLRTQTLSWPRALLIPVMWALPVIYTISGFISQYHGTLFGTGIESDTAGMVSLLAGVATLAALYQASRKDVLRVILALVAGTAVALLVQIVRMSVFPGLLIPTVGAASPTLVGSWHDLMQLVAMFVIVGVSGMAVQASRMGAKVRIFFLTLVGLVLLLSANFADIWIGIAASSVLLLLALAFLPSQNDVSTPRQKFTRTLPLTILAVVGGALFYLGPQVYAAMPSMLKLAILDIRPSMSSTIDITHRVFQSSGSFFGSGPNTFARSWTTFRPSEVNATNYWNTAFDQGWGFIPTAGATVGAVGVAVWVVLVLLLIMTIVQLLRVASAADLPVITMLSAASLFMWTLNVIYVPSTTVIAISFLCVGILVAYARAAGILGKNDIYFSFNYKTVGIEFVTLVLAWAVVGTTYTWAAESMMNYARVQFAKTQDTSIARTWVQRSIALSPAATSYRALSDVSFIELQRLIATSTELSVQQKDTARALIDDTVQAALTAVKNDDKSYDGWITLAGLYSELTTLGIEGAGSNAQQAFEKARVLAPQSPEPYVGLARIALSEKNNKVAKENLAKALALKTNYVPAYVLTARIALSEKDLVTAIAAAEGIAKSAPYEPLSWYQLAELYLAKGMKRDAGLALEQAISLQPNFSDALFMYAGVLDELGATDAALDVLERVRSLNPEESAVQKRIEQLRSKAKPQAGTAATSVADTPTSTPVR
jgi:tetratricopeptide (TPR) repeat protein